MKELKLQQFIEDSNKITSNMNMFLEDCYVVDKFDKKKKFERCVRDFAEENPDFYDDIFELGLRMLTMDHLVKREHCKKCENRACEEE